MKRVRARIIESTSRPWERLSFPCIKRLSMRGRYGPYIKKYVTIPKKRFWVRHDKHIHVDFDVPCQVKS
jgi:penicillin-insensitive murein endopeptidase